MQFQMQKGCKTRFQASHPWRIYARVYVSLVNVACLGTDTPFRCATGLRHVPEKTEGRKVGKFVPLPIPASSDLSPTASNYYPTPLWARGSTSNIAASHSAWYRPTAFAVRDVVKEICRCFDVLAT